MINCIIFFFRLKVDRFCDYVDMKIELKILLFISFCCFGISGIAWAGPPATGISLKDTVLVNSYIDSAWANNNRNFSKVYYYATHAIFLSEKIGYQRGLARSRIAIGTFYNMTGKPDEAIRQMKLALEYFEKSNQKQSIAIACKNIAISYASKAQLDEAIQWALKAREKFDELDDHLNIAQTLGLLGTLCRDVNDPGQAFNYFLQAKKLFSELGNQERLNCLTVFIGEYYYNKNRVDSALSCFRAAYEYYSVNRPSDLMFIDCCHYLGRIYIEQKKIPQALEVLNNGLRSSEVLGHGMETEVKLNLDLTQLYLETGDYLKALTRARIAEELAKKSHPNFLSDVYAQFYRVYKKMNEPGLALNYHELHTAESDSLRSRENQDLVRELEAKYQDETKKKQILILNKENETYKLTFRFYLVLIIFSVSLVLFLIILIYRKRGRLKQHRKLLGIEKTINQLHEENFEKDKTILRSELETKQSELLALSSSMTRNNEMNMQFIERIRQVAGRDGIPDQLSRDLFQATHEMEHNSVMGSWSDFNKRFVDLHPTFMENLNKVNPNLSRADIRLAALLRMNLSPKDIAKLTMQSPNSVYVASHRLRKKLGIDDDNKLYNFLLSVES
jgi:tetratricopeptide (TPR) repeat protein